MTKEERVQLRVDIKRSERMRVEIHAQFKSDLDVDAVEAWAQLEALDSDIAVRLRRVRST